MKIIITGSLGNIGKPLCWELISKGHSVTVISSNPGKRNAIQALGAMAAIGSLSDARFLTASFTGADAVFCMIPPSYAAPDQIAYYQGMGENYREAILETGVKRVVHLSSCGAHLPAGTGFITGSYRVEQILNSIRDIRLTHIRPTYFYYNLLPFIPMIKSMGFIGAVYGGNDQIALVAPEDIAVAVTEELVKGNDIMPVRYVGSDNRSCNEIAAVIGKAIGRPDLKWMNMPKDDVRNNLLKNGLPEEYAGQLVELGEAIHTGKILEDYDWHIPELGKVKLEEYAASFAQIFNAE